jgi:hypothetical protein
LEEAEKLYNKLMTELTNRTMAAAAASIMTSSLPPLCSNDQEQPDEQQNTKVK